MNKKLLKFKLVLLIALFVIMCATSYFMFCKGNLGFINRREPMNTGISTMSGQKYEFKDITTLDINTASLPIYVFESDVECVTLVDNTSSFGVSVGSENRVDSNNGTLYFSQGKRLSFFSFSVGNVSIAVPYGTVLDHNLTSISGSVKVEVSETSNVFAKSTSGSVRITGSGKNIDATSTSGSVRVF